MENTDFRFREHDCLFYSKKENKSYYGKTIVDIITGNLLNIIVYEDTVICDLDNEFTKTHNLKRVEI